MVKKNIRAFIAISTLQKCLIELSDTKNSHIVAERLTPIIKQYSVMYSEKELEEVKKEIHSHKMRLMSDDDVVWRIIKRNQDIPMEYKMKYFAVYSFYKFIELYCKKYMGKRYEIYITPVKIYLDGLLEDIFF